MSNDIEENSGDAMLENENQPYVPVTGRRCCTEHRRRVSYGMFLTTFIASCWVGATHLLKAMYVDYTKAIEANALLMNSSALSRHSSTERPGMAAPSIAHPVYNAPFFTTWFCTTFNFFFYPVYLTSRFCSPSSDKTSLRKEITDSIQPYQERGYTVVQFTCRCGMFTVLWVITNYMFVQSLRLLDATDVIALYTTNVAFIYLLSWVILQEQFVGIRIVAVITCNTGIALLAYMDGVSRSATLGGVVLAASAAAGTAVYKVLFKKVLGEVNFGQMSFFFTSVGFCNVLMMWPFFLTLYFTNVETIHWNHLPWLPLLGAALFIFLANILGNFGVIWTYEVFLTLGLIFAIPASAVVDVYMYSVVFHGMKLAGILLTMIGFFLVLLPENWPDYLTLLLRWRRNKYSKDNLVNQQTDIRKLDRSRLRTQSGRVK